MDENKKRKILVLNGQYLPGYKGGGPIQSCANMIENLSDEFEFYVLCADRDFKCDKPYDNIKINDWNQIGSAKVFYMSPEKQTIKGFSEIFKKIDFDVIYLNGFFSPIFTIKPLIVRLFGGLKGKKVILTPRGDFTGGCENKKFKKYLYIYLCKIIGLYSGLVWHATSELEERDIIKKFKKAQVFTVPNLSTKYIFKEKTLEKKVGELKLVFISRIFPKKNLKFALEILKDIKEGNITFDIYGPMEDVQYWKECRNIINQMPVNVKVKYKGEVEHCKIENIFRMYHAFLFPTLGENYGHVIVESISYGCPVIISKGTTPWDDYHCNGGYVIDLNDANEFVNSIITISQMTLEEYESFSNKNYEYISEKNCNKKLKEDYLYMFEEIYNCTKE